MNNDRFLTRIWDKQEKRMLYIMKDYIGIGNDCFVNTKQEKIIIVLFKDRFVPMMCSGLPDKNGKLIYEGDISEIDWVYNIKGNSEKIKLILKLDGYMKSLQGYEVFPKYLMHNFAPHMYFPNSEIIGNKFEQPKLMGVKA